MLLAPAIALVAAAGGIRCVRDARRDHGRCAHACRRGDLARLERGVDEQGLEGASRQEHPGHVFGFHAPTGQEQDREVRSPRLRAVRGRRSAERPRARRRLVVSRGREPSTPPVAAVAEGTRRLRRVARQLTATASRRPPRSKRSVIPLKARTTQTRSASSPSRRSGRERGRPCA